MEERPRISNADATDSSRRLARGFLCCAAAFLALALLALGTVGIVRLYRGPAESEMERIFREVPQEDW